MGVQEASASASHPWGHVPTPVATIPRCSSLSTTNLYTAAALRWWRECPGEGQRCLARLSREPESAQRASCFSGHGAAWPGIAQSCGKGIPCRGGPKASPRRRD